MTLERMQAAVLHGKEDVRVESVPVPRLEPGDVLVRVGAALVCGTDVKVYRRGYHARMIVPPALFGHEMAGTVVGVAPGGEGAEWSPGARVVAANSAPCGRCEYCVTDRANLCDDLLFWNGAYAELVRIPARVARVNLLALPGDLAFRDAALTEPLACVVRGVADCRIAPGQWVAVIGTGAIALLWAAVARLRGARVVVAGRRPGRLEAARALGAEAVVAAGGGDELVSGLRRVCDGRGAHVVVEAVGLPETSEAAVAAVRKGGLVNLFAGCPAGTRIALDAPRLHYEELTITSSFHHSPASVREALGLIATRKLDARAFVTAEATLGDVPEVLASWGGGALKTAIVP